MATYRILYSTMKLNILEGGTTNLEIVVEN